MQKTKAHKRENMNVKLDASWKEVLKNEFEKDYFKNLTEFGGSFEAQIWYTFGAGKKAESETPAPPTEPKSP